MVSKIHVVMSSPIDSEASLFLSCRFPTIFLKHHTEKYFLPPKRNLHLLFGNQAWICTWIFTFLFPSTSWASVLFREDEKCAELLNNFQNFSCDLDGDECNFHFLSFLFRKKWLDSSQGKNVQTRAYAWLRWNSVWQDKVFVNFLPPHVGVCLRKKQWNRLN